MQLLLNELADDILEWVASLSLGAVLCSRKFPFPMLALLGVLLAGLNSKELSLDAVYLCPINPSKLLFDFPKVLLNLCEHCFSMCLFLEP